MDRKPKGIDELQASQRICLEKQSGDQADELGLSLRLRTGLLVSQNPYTCRVGVIFYLQSQSLEGRDEDARSRLIGGTAHIVEHWVQQLRDPISVNKVDRKL